MATDLFAPRSRLANFLLQLTAPVEVDGTSSATDLTRQAEVLGLVLAIVADADFGLSLEPVERPRSRDPRPVWRLVAARSGGRFSVRPAARGGYDLEVELCGARFDAHALTFEALAMSLRSLAVMRCQPQVGPRAA